MAAEVEGRALAFAGTTLADLHGELRARRAADGALSGSGDLQLGALSVRLAEHEPLTLPGAAVTLVVAESAGGKGEHSLEGLERQRQRYRSLPLDASCVVLDASAPQEQLVRRAKALIWARHRESIRGSVSDPTTLLQGDRPGNLESSE